MTKLKGDIAEQAFLLAALKRGYQVLRPIGDRLPYDLALDIDGQLVRVQVKSAWYDSKPDAWIVDNRRTKTNRRVMLRAVYSPDDFDVAAIYLDGPDCFYVMPVDVFTSWAGPISFVEGLKRQRVPRSARYREAWSIIDEDVACRQRRTHKHEA